ncbi:MAG: exodeoxyribonuclease VII small subunit [Lentisphaeria bacterium]|nr:exodeoxyribonuclease VII small subunit [Lentisphaeria bacterium]MBR7127859.1 exodeoxyribonuclease VII small subunit [Lentisphaeria bacterium]
MDEKELKNLSYEQLTEILNNLIGKMESNQIPLEELLANYEKGSLILEECRKRLADFEKKIEVLTRDDGQNGEWNNFTPETDRVRKDNNLF